MTSSQEVKKARLSAEKAKTFRPCVACKSYGNRCNESRPCTRCIKLSRICVPLQAAERSFLNQLLIERPLAQIDCSIKINTQYPTPSIDCNIEWVYNALSRQVKLGIQVNDVANSFASLTLEIRHEISHALSLVRETTQFLQPSTTIPPDRRDISAANTTCRTSAAECWRDELRTGFVSARFDPSGHRQCLLVNPRQVGPLSSHAAWKPETARPLK